MGATEVNNLGAIAFKMKQRVEMSKAKDILKIKQNPYFYSCIDLLNISLRKETRKEDCYLNMIDRGRHEEVADIFKSIASKL